MSKQKIKITPTLVSSTHLNFNQPKTKTSRLLLFFPIPLLNPRSPFLASFPCLPPISPPTISIPTISFPLPIPISIPNPIPITTSSSTRIIISITRSLSFSASASPSPPRTITPAPAPAPLRRKQFPPQFSTNLLNMHKITITTTITAILLILPTSRLTKIRNRRKIR